MTAEASGAPLASPAPPLARGPRGLALRLTAVLALGLALGAASRLGDRLPAGPDWIANLAGPWLAVAFLVGFTCASRRLGALLGALVLLTGVASYYAVLVAEQGGVPVPAAASFWLGGALVGGPLLGAAGAVLRSRHGVHRGAAVVLLAGTLAGESAFLLERGHSLAESAVIGSELLVGLALPLVLIRSWRERAIALAATALLSGTVLAGLNASYWIMWTIA